MSDAFRPASPAPPPSDEVARRTAVTARGESVLVEGGAGTGKTTLLAARIVSLIAPEEEADEAPESADEAPEIGEVAVICAGPRQAAALRRAVRGRLVAEIEGLAQAQVREAAPGREEAHARRAARLRAALAGMGAVPAWTLPDLAGRLLRRKALEVGLGPLDALVDDPTELAREAFAVLLDAAQLGTLAATLEARPLVAGTPVEARQAQDLPRSLVMEAEQTVQEALRLGLLVSGDEGERGRLLGLEDLVVGFILGRDCRPHLDDRPTFDRERFRRAVDALVTLAAPVGVASPGAAWIQGCALVAASVRDKVEPLVILRSLEPALGALRDRTRRRSFDGDPVAWEAWKTLSEGRGRPNGVPLFRELLGPAQEQLAARLARLEPVALALHERVMRRRRALDPLELLLKLRDLLATNPDARGARGARGAQGAREELQGLFRHVVVDDLHELGQVEAEIVLYLGEEGARARSAREVVLGAGRVTLALDPLPSLDPARAEETPGALVRARALESGARRLRLSTSHRATPALTGWLSARLPALLPALSKASPAPGEDALPPRLDPAHAPAQGVAGFTSGVHVLPFALASRAARAPVAAWRAVEARALAAYLAWLGESGEVEVRTEDGRQRPAGYGDVVVLALDGAHLDTLYEALDARGVPHTRSGWGGGGLSLDDPLVQRFLLGLRALADPDDGAARAALLRPPFFALTADDLWRHRAATTPGVEGVEGVGHVGRVERVGHVERAQPVGGSAGGLAGAGVDPAVARVEAALGRIEALRARRLTRAPGATARDLLAQTAFGEVAGRGVNGAAQLGRLHALCFALGELAARKGLDYDAATAQLRGWLERPGERHTREEGGEGVPGWEGGDEDAERAEVRVVMAHQAGGMEAPVVALWDGHAPGLHGASPRLPTRAWWVDGRSGVWAVVLSMEGGWQLTWGEEALARARDDLLQERRYLTYRAITRARDLLVLPRPEGVNDGGLLNLLLREGVDPVVVEFAVYREGAGAAWTPWGPERARGKEHARGKTQAAGEDAAEEDAAEEDAAEEDEERGALTEEAGALKTSAMVPADAVARRFQEVARAAVRSRPPPEALWTMGGEALSPVFPEDPAEPPGQGAPETARACRFEPPFGATVRRALYLVVNGMATPERAVRIVARETGLKGRLGEASRDVTRARVALRNEGLWEHPDVTLYTDYPVAGMEGGSLRSGVVDLVAVSETHVDLLEIRTEVPPTSLAEVQLRSEALLSCARLLGATPLSAGKRLRFALLFTAEARLFWV